MSADILLHLAGWIPLWVIALRITRRPQWGSILLGTLLAALVGGLCGVELRRHGVTADVVGWLVVPLLGIRVDELIRFGLIGGGGAAVAGALLDRTEP